MSQCPMLTPAQRRAMDVIASAEKTMIARMVRTIEEAAEEVKAKLKSVSPDEPPPAFEYFAAVAHRALFLKLCGADQESGLGGDPVLAAAILDSDRKYAALYWKGQTIEETLATSNPQNVPQEDGGSTTQSGENA